jgi:hypothetical protein
MKRRFVVLLTVTISLITHSLLAQSVKEGKLTYKIKYLDETIDAKTSKSMPGMLTLTFKGNKSRLDYGSTIKIVNPSAKKVYYCTVAKGKKSFTEWSVDDERFQSKREPKESKVTGETRTVGGITCIRTLLNYYLTDKDAFQEYDVWCAPSVLPVSMHEFIFDGSKGLPLIFDTVLDGISMHLEASQLDKTPVPDTKFSIPTGYSKAKETGNDTILVPSELKTMEVK